MPKAKKVPKQDAELASVKLPGPINPLGVQSVYSNNMQLMLSALDARLLFNEILSEGGPIMVERRANIVMPVPHLRAMAKVLNDNISALDERLADRAKKRPVIEK
jgi:hypothetical protein